MCVCGNCTSLSAAGVQLGWLNDVWNVQCAPHVGRFRPQTLTAPHPTEHPPQQEQLRGQPEQCQGNGLIRQARFTAPPCPAPAHIVSQDLAWKLSIIGDKNWTAGNPSKIDTPLNERFLFMFGKSLLGLDEEINWGISDIMKTLQAGGHWVYGCAVVHCPKH